MSELHEFLAAYAPDPTPNPQRLRAEAWDEGYQAATDYHQNLAANNHSERLTPPPTPNPYREGETQ